MRIAVRVCITLALLVASAALCQQRKFPKWEVASVGLSGTWERAPTAVVGEVRNITAVGDEPAGELPWPAGPWIKRIYWCEADFYAYAAIKGSLPRAKRYLWGAIRPGCKLDHPSLTDRTQVWFIREEGEYVRPVVDAGGYFYITFRVEWDYKSKDDPEAQFGRLLLNPAAQRATLRQFAKQLNYGAVDTGCWILGRKRCVDEMRALASLGDPDLTRAACDFLRERFDEPCKR